MASLIVVVDECKKGFKIAGDLAPEGSFPPCSEVLLCTLSSVDCHLLTTINNRAHGLSLHCGVMAQTQRKMLVFSLVALASLHLTDVVSLT